MADASQPPLPAAALFDLDGTLVDSHADIAHAMNWALTQHGFPAHGLDAYLRFVGEGVRLLVARACPPGTPEAVQDAVLATYRARYGAHLLHHTRPFPGVLAVLQALQARGVPLGVLSNKGDDFTKAIVAALLPGVAFGAVYGERPGVPRKPDPAAALQLARELGAAPGACAFVGDTPVDVRTARAAGMRPVAVAWGFRTEQELREAGADVVVHDAGALARALGV